MGVAEHSGHSLVKGDVNQEICKMGRVRKKRLDLTGFEPAIYWFPDERLSDRGHLDMLEILSKFREV